MVKADVGNFVSLSSVNNPGGMSFVLSSISLLADIILLLYHEHATLLQVSAAKENTSKTQQ